MFSNYTEEARKVLVNMKQEMMNLRHPYIGSEHLFLSILKYGDKDLVLKLEKHGISYNSFKNELIKIVGIGKKSSDFYLYTPLLKRVLEEATYLAKERNRDNVTCNELFLSLIEEGEGIAIRILLGMNIDIDLLYEEFSSITKRSKKTKLLIDSFGICLNDKCKNNEIDPVIGREKEINRVVEILTRRTKNNPLLIGDAGVGKTAIVEELARRITEGKIKSLQNKKIISVSMSSLVAGTKYRGEFEERLGKIIKELEQDKEIIIFIDEIHTLVGAGGAEGAIDASNILKPALARGKIKIIGATTTEEYKTYIKEDKALDRRFQLIDVKEPTLEDTKRILTKLTPIYEGYHKVKLSDRIINSIVELSSKYIYDRKMPDKAIDILDEVCSKVANSKCIYDDKLEELTSKLNDVKKRKDQAIMSNDFSRAYNLKKEEKQLESYVNEINIKEVERLSYKSVTLKDVKKVIEEKSKIPVFDETSISNIKFLKKYLNDNIYGQEEAINKLFEATKKIRYGLNKKGVPYSFLFVGNSGVGKTLLAKIYAEKMYGIDNFIRLDMSEYKESHSISKIIGSPPGYVGYSDNKNVFEEIKDKPYSVILLDEIEKASKNVINLFLQILDYGKAKDSKGNVVFFDNTIIIMTSNLTANYQEIGFCNDTKNLKKQELVNFFGSSFYNRISDVILFNNMTKDTIIKIINNKIKEIRNCYKLRGISFSLSKESLEKIVDLCEYEQYGARRIDKVLSNYIEKKVIDSLIEGKTSIKINVLKEKVA